VNFLLSYLSMNTFFTAPSNSQQPHRNGMPKNLSQGQQQQMSSQAVHQMQQQQMNEGTINDETSGGGGVANNGQKIRENLHHAADNVSSAMNSLVRELNTGAKH
jgi:hypothetical protein